MKVLSGTKIRGPHAQDLQCEKDHSKILDKLPFPS